MPAPVWRTPDSGPLEYFARHRWSYAAATAAATATSVYAAIRARRSERGRRLAFAALSLNCAVQAAWLVVGTERRRRAAAH